MTRPIGGYEESAYLVEGHGGFPAADNAELLGEPLPGTFGGIEGLYLLMSLDARNDTQATAREVLDANEARREAWERQLAAAERQREAEDDAGFWGGVVDNLGTVAKVAGCVAAVAFAVCTAGAGTPVAVLAISGAVASSASLAQSQWGVFDDVLGAKNADRFGFWLGVGGAAMSLGAGALLFFGVGALGQAAAAAEAARTAQQAAMVVGGASGMAAGGARIAQAHYESEAAEHHAAAVQAKLQAQMQQFLLDQLIVDMEDTQERETANLKRIVSINNLHIAGLTAVTKGMA